MRKYSLIAIEGCDGAGKATLAAGMLVAMRERGLDASSFSFPNYSTATGQALRAHLRGEWRAGDPQSIVSYDESVITRHRDMLVRQSLMTVNRFEAQTAIEEALERGPVILDRWWASSVAYGVAEGLDREWLTTTSSALLKPDLWLLLDIDPEVAAHRREARDLNERDPDKQRRVRAEYWRLADEDSRGPYCDLGRWRTVNAMQPVESVLREALSHVDSLETADLPVAVLRDR